MAAPPRTDPHLHRVEEDRLYEECEWKPGDNSQEHDPLEDKTAPSCLTSLAFSWKPWALEGVAKPHLILIKACKGRTAVTPFYPYELTKA